MLPVHFARYDVDLRFQSPHREPRPAVEHFGQFPRPLKNVDSDTMEQLIKPLYRTVRWQIAALAVVR
jgi:hypothetical protein